jgi:uncharacterized protein
VSACTAAPLASLHRFETAFGPHLLVADGTRLYALTQALARDLDHAASLGEAATTEILAAHGLAAGGTMTAKALDTPPPVRSLSLAVAQACNLGCGYCYAGGGSFGGKPAAMDWEVARDAITLLIAGAAPGERVQLAFLGGEPMLARALVRKAAAFAADEAARKAVGIAFALTTNATVLRPEDADFFATHRFALTISLDGTSAQHDRQRPTRKGAGSYHRILDNLRVFLARPDIDMAARVTVTPQNLDLPEALAHLAGLGFPSIGFSPMLSSPNGKGELQADDIATLLAQMIACGRMFVDGAIAGAPLPFENMRSALREIHRGTHRPYPCGAGAGYLGVSAQGDLSACHRFVGDEAGAMGSLQAGIDEGARSRWLQARAVDAQTPCGACWARYLCGGGCHHEVIHRGRPACDYIRGWLEFCLSAYVTLQECAPGFIA